MDHTEDKQGQQGRREAGSGSQPLNTDQAIRNRRTQKVLAEQPWPLPTDREALDKIIRELLDLAAHAPYHKKAHETHTEDSDLSSCLPYRFYVLDAANCRRLLKYMEEQEIKGGKINQMLAAADALLLVTWLPDPPGAGQRPSDRDEEPVPFAGTVKNMEHIAAGAAAIQNVLLGATARGIPSYWSSGGVLRLPPLRRKLGVPLLQILLGAVFLFPGEAEQGAAEVKLGKLRDQGKEQSTWSRWVEIG